MSGKYFVGGVDRNLTTSDSLRRYFELFGELTDAVVMMKEGRSRGFGFVTFANPAALPPNFAISLHVVDGKQVDVKSAVPEEETRGPAGIKKLFIGGITAATTKEMLEAHFGQFGTITDAVVMEMGGQPRGFGFVTYESADMATAAVTYAGGHLIDGKMVDVKKAEPKGSPALHPGMNAMAAFGGFGGFGAFGPMGPMGPMGGYGGAMMMRGPPGPMRRPFQAAVTPKPQGQYGSTENPHSIGSKIFVGGLPRTSNEDSMAAYFSAFGTIVGCEVMRRDGVSRGFGFIVFSTDHEAAMCLAQPAHLIDGKAVECKACQPKTPEPPAHSMGGGGGYPTPGMGMGMGMGMGAYPQPFAQAYTQPPPMAAHRYRPY